jgi:hypothetical protein
MPTLKNIFYNLLEKPEAAAIPPLISKNN